MRALVSIALICTSTRCGEEIPPFIDPSDLFIVSATGQYVLTLEENAAHISVSIKSNYHETLQAVALMKGSVGVALVRDPTIKRTIPLTAADLFTIGKYNPSTKVLTFDPGDILRFDVVWDLRDDNGLYVPDALFHYNTDPVCHARCVADEELFGLTGTIQLFDGVAPIVGKQAPFSFCHVTRYVAQCPPASVTFPCSATHDFIVLPCDTLP